MKSVITKIKRDSLSYKLLLSFCNFVNELYWIRQHQSEIMYLMPGYRESKKQLYNSLYQLRKRNYISYRDTDKTYFLTSKGKKLVKEFRLEEIAKEKSKKQWDGVWRLVIFDIPEDLKRKRNILRSLLKRLAFQQLQKSVWICAYPVLGEVQELLSMYFLDKYVILMESRTISKSYLLKERFLKSK